MEFEIAKRILEANRGANFVKADLHIHTPGSNEWDEKNPDPNFKTRNITPGLFVQQAIGKGLGLIAITDHNSVEWCEPIIDAAKDTPLVVLPGFELSVRPGVHLLGLFNQNDGNIVDSMRDLLKKFGIDKANFGDHNTLTEKTIEDIEFPIIRAIESKGGIAIPAHIHSNSGFIGRLKGGAAASDFLEKSGCGILETNLVSIPEIVKTMLREDPNRFGIIDNTDAHQLQQIGCNQLWLKMDEVGLNGLRQISVEPVKRIRYVNDGLAAKTRILGLYSNGGLLRDQVIAFNSELNCLIGGRGAGKSVIVDYLRFVFNSVPVDEDLRTRLFDRFADLIRDSSTVYVLVEDREGKLWLYKRQMKFERKRRGSRETIELNSDLATLFQIIQHPPQAVRINDNLPNHKFEFYGQGEVQSITETAEPSRQLKLIDNFIQMSIEPKNRKCEALTEQISALENEILVLDEEIDRLEHEIAELTNIEARIAEIELDLQANNLSDHQVWEDANHWILEANGHLLRQKGLLDSVSFTGYEKRVFNLPVEGANTVFNKLLEQIIEALNLLIRNKVEIKEKIDDLAKKIQQSLEEWNRLFNDEKEKFAEILRKQGVENLAALNTELANKKQVREKLQTRDIPRLAEARTERAERVKEREEVLKNLLQVRSEIRQARENAARRMTEKLGETILVEVDEQKNLNEFYSTLMDCTPTDIHSKHDQIQKIVDNLSPMELATAIREKNVDWIREVTGVTPRTAGLLIELKNQELMKVERIRCDDLARVYLMLEGNRKSLNDLSQGEKCTAILSVILLDEHSPLVIDQPEDELDHNFIMANVVNTLGSVKQKCDPLVPGFAPKSGRQFIIATHNQNIPVLGDAELIIKMHKVLGEERCESESSHGLEHPETIKHILSLEGGKDAFNRRRKKYELSM